MDSTLISAIRHVDRREVEKPDTSVDYELVVRQLFQFSTGH